MRLGASDELAHLSSIQGRYGEDIDLIQELGRRLEALRRYDQYFSDADWHPRAQLRGWPRGDDGDA